jgi:dTDP-4-amino-4,6-dideoxygalactose transaminase
MLAHALGNPFNLAKVTELVKNMLWLIEDTCDALVQNITDKSGNLWSIRNAEFLSGTPRQWVWAELHL